MLSELRPKDPPDTPEERARKVEFGLVRAKAALPWPLSYTVVRDDPKCAAYVSVRSCPDSRAFEVDRLPHGCTVKGHPVRGWLCLSKGNGAGLENKWVFIGRQLAALCLRATVQRRMFPDRLEVVWPGLPGSNACYSVDWEVGSTTDSDNKMQTFGQQVVIYGVPANSKVRVRVVAVFPDPFPDDARGPFRVFGPWTEAEAEGPGDAGPCLGLVDTDVSVEDASAAEEEAPTGGEEEPAPQNVDDAPPPPLPAEPAAASQHSDGPAEPGTSNAGEADLPEEPAPRNVDDAPPPPPPPAEPAANVDDAPPPPPAEPAAASQRADGPAESPKPKEKGGLREMVSPEKVSHARKSVREIVNSYEAAVSRSSKKM